MAENTKIEWCDATFNPWTGCSKVSPACANCYAEAWAKRSGLVQWGDQAERHRTSASNWRQPLKWNREAEKAGERRRVFCASLADVFEHKPELMPWRADLFRLIHNTPNLNWLLLTKRPENWMAHLNAAMIQFDSEHDVPMIRFASGWLTGSHGPSNVWIGATVEDQKHKHRIDRLRDIPATVRFLSIEPLLEDMGNVDLTGIHWAIIGGESGPNARPMHSDHLISLRDQCLAAGVPVFIKQMGNQLAKKFGCRDPKGGDMGEWPAEYRIRQFPQETR